MARMRNRYVGGEELLCKKLKNMPLVIYLQDKIFMINMKVILHIRLALANFADVLHLRY